MAEGLDQARAGGHRHRGRGVGRAELFGIWHGTDLAVAWVAPDDSSSQLTTVGAWASGGSLIRVRVDEAVSYDAATGASAVDAADARGGRGLQRERDELERHHRAHRLRPGLDDLRPRDGGRSRHRPPALVGLGAEPLQRQAATGALAVAAGTAIVLTDDGIAGVTAASGAQRWTLASPNGCTFQQLAASGGSVVALAACDGSYDVVSVDPATGKAAWRHRVTEPSNSYQFQILSASPVVINDDLTGPRGTSTVRVFGPDGAVTSDFNVSGIPLGGGTVALNTASDGGFGVPVAVADGMLVGVTEPSGSGADAIVGYRLADGSRQWLVDTPDEVNDVALSGNELVFVDESDPAYSLEEVDVETGTLRSLGYFTQGILQSGQSGLYAFGADDLVVNTTGDSADQPPVAAIKAPAAQG